eukprot:TRINITY_DN1941_c0_g1_i1.p1 TRINITY_DN1941_c0_g1~~TRINITY_DN1941_c0_g1_i1.p1  ORF type:complete len:504 (+),score=94.40 TRINITY_DN1941_c0_g1_i1:63-1574(+)
MSMDNAETTTAVEALSTALPLSKDPIPTDAHEDNDHDHDETHKHDVSLQNTSIDSQDKSMDHHGDSDEGLLNLSQERFGRSPAYSLGSTPNSRKRGRGPQFQTRVSKQYIVTIDGEKYRLLTKNRLYVVKQFGRWSPFVEIVAEGTNKPERIVNGFAVLDPDLKYFTRVRPEVIEAWKEYLASKGEIAKGYSRNISRKMRKFSLGDSPQDAEDDYDSNDHGTLSQLEEAGFYLSKEDNRMRLGDDQHASHGMHGHEPVSLSADDHYINGRKQGRPRGTKSFGESLEQNGRPLPGQFPLDGAFDPRRDTDLSHGIQSLANAILSPDPRSGISQQTLPPIANSTLPFPNQPVLVPDVLQIDQLDTAPRSPIQESQGMSGPSEPRFEYHTRGMVWRILNVAPIRPLTPELLMNMECHLLEQETVRVYVAHDHPGYPFLVQAVTFLRKIYSQEICLAWWKCNGAQVLQFISNLETERFNRLYSKSTRPSEPLPPINTPGEQTDVPDA